MYMIISPLHFQRVQCAPSSLERNIDDDRHRQYSPTTTEVDWRIAEGEIKSSKVSAKECKTVGFI